MSDQKRTKTDVYCEVDKDGNTSDVNMFPELFEPEEIEVIKARVKDYNMEHDPETGKFAETGEGGSGSIESTKSKLLEAAKSFANIPNENDRVDLLLSYMKNYDEIVASLPEVKFVSGSKPGSIEYDNFFKTTEMNNALRYGGAGHLIYPGSISKENQKKIADAWLSASPTVRNNSPVGNSMYHTFDVATLDHLGKSLPKDYHGTLEMFSTDYERFAPAFIQNWTISGGSKALYLSGESSKGIDGNVGKDLYEGDKTNRALEKSENVTANLEKMYEQTQKFYREKLSKKGVTNLDDATITIQRGVGSNAITENGYTPWAAESWTVDKGTPKRFGKLLSGSRGYSILTADVPYSGILMSWEAQKGIWPAEKDLHGKKEIVALGGALKNMKREDF